MTEVALPTRQIKRYGWRADTPDARDFFYAADPLTTLNLPRKFSLRSGMPSVSDQLQLGSCTANALGGAFEFDMMRAKDADAFPPSRLFIYYLERVIEGSVDEDSGAMIRDGVKALNRQGAPPESDWPYNIDRFADKPPASAYAAAVKHKVTKYSRVTQSQTPIQTAIFEGFPVVFGFTVYESFETQQVTDTGLVPMPGKNEEVLGGHAVLKVGWDLDHKNGPCWEVRNSWGSGWGDGGYFWMPMAYSLDRSLASDFWTLKVVAD